MEVAFFLNAKEKIKIKAETITKIEFAKIVQSKVQEVNKIPIAASTDP